MSHIAALDAVIDSFPGFKMSVVRGRRVRWIGLRMGLRKTGVWQTEMKKSVMMTSVVRTGLNESRVASSKVRRTGVRSTT